MFGIQRGAIFGLVGLGLALVYKATRILNFAQGELGTVPAFVAFLVMTGFETGGDEAADRGLLLPATLAAVVVGAVLGVVLYALVIRPLGKVSPVTSLVATAGVALLLTTDRDQRLRGHGPGGSRARSTAASACPAPTSIVDWHTIVILAVLAGVAARPRRVLPQRARRRPAGHRRGPASPPSSRACPSSACGRMAWGAAGALGALAGVLGAGVFESLTPGPGHDARS